MLIISSVLLYLLSNVNTIAMFLGVTLIAKRSFLMECYNHLPIDVFTVVSCFKFRGLRFSHPALKHIRFSKQHCILYK